MKEDCVALIVSCVFLSFQMVGFHENRLLSWKLSLSAMTFSFCKTGFCLFVILGYFTVMPKPCIKEAQQVRREDKSRCLDMQLSRGFLLLCPDFFLSSQ